MNDLREPKPVRVLIVDDDLLMRSILGAVLASDWDITVVGQASSAEEARRAINFLNPDVITLDVMMPGMNGLDFLDKIMQSNPIPVVMVSGLTTRGADATIRALEAGAVECVAKPSPGNLHPFGDLTAIVKIAATARVRGRQAWRPETPIAPIRTSAYAPGGKIVAIGSSTGGVEALGKLLSEFPANCPPTVVVQHMPAHFTTSFAARLDRLCAPKVHEAADGQPIEQGCVYLAPGGAAHLEVVASRGLRCQLRRAEPVNYHRPSVDTLFMSVCEAVHCNAIGVILTGMGRDGAAGLLAMRKAGAHTFGQDETTCLIYGMPKVAFDLGAVEMQLRLPEIAHAVLAASASAMSV